MKILLSFVSEGIGKDSRNLLNWQQRLSSIITTSQKLSKPRPVMIYHTPTPLIRKKGLLKYEQILQKNICWHKQQDKEGRSRTEYPQYSFSIHLCEVSRKQCILTQMEVVQSVKAIEDMQLTSITRTAQSQSTNSFSNTTPIDKLLTLHYINIGRFCNKDIPVHKHR